jgi:hypothetical protein
MAFVISGHCLARTRDDETAFNDITRRDSDTLGGIRDQQVGVVVVGLERVEGGAETFADFHERDS